MALVRPLVAALVGLAAAAPAAWSAAITVDSGADDGAGSLRAAIATAAATHEADAISVAVPSIALQSPLPALPAGTTLDGGGASLAPAGAGATTGLALGEADVTVRDLRVAGFPAGVVLGGDLGGSALLGLELEGNAVGVRDDGHTGTVRIGGPPAAGVPPGPAGIGDEAARVLAPLALSRPTTRPGRPARITITLARDASVELWIARRGAGRPLGAVVRRLRAGTTTLRLPLRLDGRRLAAGRYRLTARVVDPVSGATLDERRARFRIVR